MLLRSVLLDYLYRFISFYTDLFQKHSMLLKEKNSHNGFCTKGHPNNHILQYYTDRKNKLKSSVLMVTPSIDPPIGHLFEIRYWLFEYFKALLRFSIFSKNVLILSCSCEL